MWQRKNCCICSNDFGVHPQAKYFVTRQMCQPCRKVWEKKVALVQIQKAFDKIDALEDWISIQFENQLAITED